MVERWMEFTPWRFATKELSKSCQNLFFFVSFAWPSSVTHVRPMLSRDLSHFASRTPRSKGNDAVAAVAAVAPLNTNLLVDSSFLLLSD